MGFSAVPEIPLSVCLLCARIWEVSSVVKGTYVAVEYKKKEEGPDNSSINLVLFLASDFSNR